MKAVIMAGGEGSRLRPLTCGKPKPMVNVFNKPVMEHTINLLKKYGITDIAVTLQYMPEKIKEYFGNGKDFGVNIEYFVEDTPLGTAGSVKNAEEFLSDTFIVVSGDALTDINISEAIRFHLNKASIATLVLARVEVPLEYGIVITNDNGKITRFIEKPNWSEVFSDTINTGIYILDKKVLSEFNKNEKFDFSKDLFPKLLSDLQPMYGYITEDYWCDIGDSYAYQQSNFDILSEKMELEKYSYKRENNIWIGENIEIGKNVVIKGPVLIGNNVKIKDNCIIDPFTIIGDHCIINKGVSLKNTILWDNCIIGEKSQLRGCIVCDSVIIKKNCAIYEQSVIGERTKINDSSVIKPDIRIWPYKVVDENSEVNANLIWGSKFTKNIFGEKGITGEINIDINSEYASRLGAAFGSMNGDSSKIAISTDGENPSEMLKNSFISGILSSGAQVYDFCNQLLPITREGVIFYSLDGGIHISTITEKGDSKLFIDFMNSQGINIDRQYERKLENLFSREDYKRCEAKEIKGVTKLYEFKNYYLRNLINNLNNHKMSYNILISTPSDQVKDLISPVFRELNIKADFSKLRINRTSIGFSYDIREEIKYISDKVKNNGYDMGYILDKKGEKLILIDDRGEYIENETYLLLILNILLKTERIFKIVVPYSAPDIIENIGSEFGKEVVRTKLSDAALMKEMMSDSRNIQGNYQFVMNYDGVGAMFNILDFLFSQKLSLSDLVKKLPNVYFCKEEVECPWDKKGSVIRTIIEENGTMNNNVGEGVRINKKNGWVLILPDAERAVCKIVAEGASYEFAEELSNFYKNKVKNIVKT